METQAIIVIDARELPVGHFHCCIRDDVDFAFIEDRFVLVDFLVEESGLNLPAE